MKKSTKGAVAAAAAGVLLLGGAGSLAFWTDSITVGGGTINSGTLSLADTTAGTCAAASWKLDGGAVFDLANPNSKIVPGDTLTKNCTFKVNATGDHLGAVLAVSGGGATGALASEVSTAANFTVGGNSVSTINESNDGNTVSATITLTYGGASATNASKATSLVLAGYTVTATQTHDAS